MTDQNLKNEIVSFFVERGVPVVAINSIGDTDLTKHFDVMSYNGLPVGYMPLRLWEHYQKDITPATFLVLRSAEVSGDHVHIRSKIGEIGVHDYGASDQNIDFEVFAPVGVSDFTKSAITRAMYRKTEQEAA